jgi:hypothetical protein
MVSYPLAPGESFLNGCQGKIVILSYVASPRFLVLTA